MRPSDVYVSKEDSPYLENAMQKIFPLFAIAVIASSLPLATVAQSSQPTPKVIAQESDKDTAAYRNGFQDGWIDGEHAWAESMSLNLSRSGMYSRADHGYSEGDKKEYKRLYRKGFEDGYGVGYGLTAKSADKLQKR